MSNLLNYKYEIFPTTPQKYQIFKLFRMCRVQWNKAVLERKKLLNLLKKGKIENLLDTLLSVEKNSNQVNRKKAIEKLKKQYSHLSFETVTYLYDVKSIFGKLLDKRLSEFTDKKILLDYLNAEYEKENQAFKMEVEQINQELKEHKEKWVKANPEKDINNYKKPKFNFKTKRLIFFSFKNGINNYAGYYANRYQKKSFKLKGLKPESTNNGYSLIAGNISGSANSVKWNTAVNPSPEQRKFGATGEPNFKNFKNLNSYAHQSKLLNEQLIIKRKKKYQVFIESLPKGMQWIDVCYHRVLPEDSKVKQITILKDAHKFFVVFSTELLDHDYIIPSLEKGWHVGIDPGVKIPLAMGFENINTGERKSLVIQYSFIENQEEKLTKIQQKLALKQSPSRLRTEEEIKTALDCFKNNKKIKKLNEKDQQKEIEKKENILKITHVKQKPSNAWVKLDYQRKKIHYKIKMQRKDVLDKISRMLVESCDVIGFGHWEAEREVGYRKKLKELKMDVVNNISGAKERLDELITEKSKSGRKGVKTIRKGGRDRSIATLRAKTMEKAKRALKAEKVVEYQNESGTTIECNICGEKTGPKNDLEVRQWKCSNCGTDHIRDINSAFRILQKTRDSLKIKNKIIKNPEYLNVWDEHKFLSTVIETNGGKIGSLKSLLEMKIAKPVFEAIK